MSTNITVEKQYERCHTRGFHMWVDMDYLGDFDQEVIRLRCHDCNAWAELDGYIFAEDGREISCVEGEEE